MPETTPDTFDLEYDEAVNNPEESPAAPAEHKLPEKYVGKTVEDIVKMHQNAERRIALQGRDLAEQRRLTDSILELRKQTENVKAPEPVTTDELFKDPEAALNKAVGQSDIARKVDANETRLNKIETNLGQRTFESRFPDFQKDVSNPEFIEWVQNNPARTALLSGLHNWDFEAGSALWDMWQERQALTKPAQQAQRNATINAASTVRSSATDTSVKPTYSRAKLLSLQERAERGDLTARMKWNDPAFQAEYLSAYREGRVK
jgi:hypothetical protein